MEPNATLTQQPDYGTGEKTLKIYLVGIALCVLLTLLPFAVVLNTTWSNVAKLAIVFLAAFVQFIVQVLCFLRLNYKTEQSRMNTLSFLFGIVILFAVIAGSLWIMTSLYYRMM